MRSLKEVTIEQFAPHPGDSKSRTNQLLRVLLENYGDNDGLLLLDSKDQAGDAEILVYLEPEKGISLSPGQPSLENGKFWEALRSLLSETGEESSQIPPFVAGYLGYEMLHTLESVSHSSNDLVGTPAALIYLYQTVLRIPSSPDKALTLYKRPCAKVFWKATKLESIIQSALNLAKDSPASPELPKLTLTTADLERELSPYSNFTRTAYCKAVSAIKEEIVCGQVYQVNLSQQFVLPFFRSATDYFLTLREVSPAPHGAFLRLNNRSFNLAIVSASPELFFQVRSGKVLSSPIKGTRRKAENPRDDQGLILDLRNNPKDRAELSMIVDLIRNDLGRVAELGSVVVEQHARVETFAQVHHLVSDIVAKLTPDNDIIDLIKALFPCGSITGAPKIAAMKIISRLEQRVRGVYTGAIGNLSLHADSKFNVAIRTALIRDGQLIFNSGGGVVYDSIPEIEYEETLVKAKGLLIAAKITATDSKFVMNQGRF